MRWERPNMLKVAAGGIVLACLTLTACASSSPATVEDGLRPVEPAATPPAEAVETPPPAFGAEPIGSSSVKLFSDGGYEATLDLSWTAIEKVDVEELATFAPQCENNVRTNLAQQNGATQGNAFVYRVSGSVTYPEVNGFTWPEQIAPWMHFERDLPAHMFTQQNICNEDFTDSNFTLPSSPVGGAFELFVVPFSIPKTPDNPEGLAPDGPVDYGNASNTPRQAIIDSKVSIQVTSCDPSCDLFLSVPFPAEYLRPAA